MQALIVDDSSTMRKLLRQILTGAGFEVTEAESGRDALEQLNRAEPELALLDWNMPEMNGLELLGRLRSDRRHRDMKILMVTTECESSQRELALRRGADEYLMKPFGQDSILETLHSLGVLQ
jgi:two-component system chemotaxis response regulator CheY